MDPIFGMTPSGMRWFTWIVFGFLFHSALGWMLFEHWKSYQEKLKEAIAQGLTKLPTYWDDNSKTAIPIFVIGNLVLTVLSYLYMVGFPVLVFASVLASLMIGHNVITNRYFQRDMVIRRTLRNNPEVVEAVRENTDNPYLAYANEPLLLVAADAKTVTINGETYAVGEKVG